MNGIHDMGGMHGFGPLGHEPLEPVFHEPWEARAHALHTAIGAARRWSTDQFRYEIECLPPSDYLRMSYYERRFLALVKLMLDAGLINAKELETGRPEPNAPKQSPALTLSGLERTFTPRPAQPRTPAVPACYHPGDTVRARNINPVHHTRLPRYVRGKIGVIKRLHGVWPFPDTNAQKLGKNAQHLYTVRFTAREVWGVGAFPRDTVCVDLSEEYLEAA